MNLNTPSQQILAAMVAISFAASVSGATVSFTTSQPTPGPDDVVNLQGASDEGKNVNEGDHNAIYIADDRPTQGQSFTTGTNSAAYVLRAITLREVPFDTYALIPDLTYTVRIIQPAVAGLSVLSTETAKVAAEAPGNIPTISEGSNPGNGSGSFITFTLAQPVTLKPNTIYGFDISGGTDRHYWQWDGTNKDAYPRGTAYSLREGKMIERTGDHVFVVSLTRTTVTEPARASAQADQTPSARKVANTGTTGEPR